MKVGDERRPAFPEASLGRKTHSFVPPGSAGQAVEHGRPAVPQTERHGHGCSSAGRCTCTRTHASAALTEAAALCFQIVEETYKLEFLYSGLESRQVATIHHVRLQAKALQLILTARTRQGSAQPPHTHTNTHTVITRGIKPLSSFLRVDPLVSSEKFLQEVESFQRSVSERV